MLLTFFLSRARKKNLYPQQAGHVLELNLQLFCQQIDKKNTLW